MRLAKAVRGSIDRQSRLDSTPAHGPAPASGSGAGGVDNHRSGLENVHEFLTEEQKGQPGYEGYLNNNVVTIIGLIRDVGYRTSMAGKWHLGRDEVYRSHDRRL